MPFLLLAGGQSAGQPVQALVETIACRRTGGLDEPLAVLQLLQLQLFHHFCFRHGIRQVLLVGKHQQGRILHLLHAQHLLQLFLCILDAVPVRAVHHEDQPVRALEIVPVQSSDLVLASAKTRGIRNCQRPARAISPSHPPRPRQ